MAFAQLTYRESLRDIECCVRAMREKLHHIGIKGKVSRNTLAKANETRDWRIYSDFAQILIHEARRLYADGGFGLELDDTVYALDSSTIVRCLSVFPWARFRKAKGAIKLNTLLDLKGDIPTFIWIKQHLRIKKFYSTSENAVKTQIWIAVSTYVLVATMKKRLKIDLTLYTFLQILSITLFEKMPILQALTEDHYRNKITSGHIQLKLFES